ncbi:cell division protein ZapA [Parvularcula sp. ZS-1/3]|uniref:Cell division protein ZapA n=1 Tax=Parvularcula mediterranea TaxID=2732508 RepID=A0A7Y3RMK3_9PROT|nr:cell division protein ZapA [Parvularcula mediterranea]
MAEVSIQIGGAAYDLACDDGEERRLEQLAHDFDKRVGEVQSQHQSLGERHAVIMAALAVLDEFDEAKNRWASITPEGAAAEWAADRLDRASARLEQALNASV